MATVEEIAKAKALTLQNGKFINELVAGFAKDHGIESENLNYQISNMTMINNQQFDSFVDNNVVSNAELEQTDKVEQSQSVGKFENSQQEINEINLNQLNVSEPDNVDEHVSESENKNEFTGETTINEVGESIRPQNADAKNENENSNEFVGETAINEFGEIVRPENGGTSANLNSGLNENIPVFTPPEQPSVENSNSAVAKQSDEQQSQDLESKETAGFGKANFDKVDSIQSTKTGSDLNQHIVSGASLEDEIKAIKEANPDLFQKEPDIVIEKFDEELPENKNENSNENAGETFINEFGEIVRPQNGGTSATLNSGLNENIPVFIPPERKEDLEHQVDKSDEPDITVGSYIRDNIKQELLGKKRQDEDELGKGK
mgnify:CR=1 FL=1